MHAAHAQTLRAGLAGITMCFRDDLAAVNYIKAFYATMTREWQGIDRLRLDKFYHLISEFVGQALLRIKRAGWQSEISGVYNAFLIEGPLSGADSSKPLGIALQLCDNVVGGLADLGTVSVEVVMKVLGPYWNILLYDFRSVLIERVEASILGKLMAMDAEASPGESGVPVDWGQLAQMLFEVAANPKTAIKKREMLYRIRKVLLKHRKQMAKSTAAAAEVGQGDTEEEMVPSEAERPKAKAAAKAKKKRKREEPQAAAAAAGTSGTADVPQPAKAAATKTRQSARKGKKSQAAAEEAQGNEAGEETGVAAAPAKKAKVGKSKAKPKPKAVASLLAEAADESEGDTGSPAKGSSPLKSALGTPQDFTTPRRSSRIKTRRISWGDNDVRRFKKQLPPASVSEQKSKKSKGE